MKTNLSLSSLLFNLINSAPKQKKIDVKKVEENSKKGTTIRFKPETRLFIEGQAELLGISVQEFVSMTFTAIMSASNEPQATELELMVDRFIEAFTKHGIPVADIPRMLPVGAIERAHLLKKEELINQLDESVINSVVELFNLNHNWLKGVESNAQNSRGFRWYKNVAGFASRLARLNIKHRQINVMFIAENGLDFELLKEAKEEGDSVKSVDIGVIIEKESLVNGVLYKSYEIGEIERWNYWRTRYCLKSMMMFCEKASVNYDGILISKEKIKDLFYGNMMAVEVLQQYRDYWFPDILFDKGGRNLEEDELEKIKAFYKESGAYKYEQVTKFPSEIKDWKSFERELLGLT